MLSNGQENVTEVRSVRAGDRIRLVDGTYAKTLCLVKIAEPLNSTLVSLPCGLTITEKHPIRLNGQWILPKDA